MNYKPIVKINNPLNNSNKGVRQSGMYEWIPQLRFNHLSWVEPWIMGGPEIKIKAVTNDDIILISETWFLKRSDVNNKWKSIWARLGHWYFPNLEALAYKFIEDDRNWEGEIPLSFTYEKDSMIFKIGFTMKFSEKDDDIFETVVFSSDGQWQTYGNSIGIMQFKSSFAF